MRVAVAAAVTVAVAGGAIGVAAYVKSNATSAPALGTNGSRGPKFGRDGTLVPANALKAPAPRKVDHAHPLKLWIGGDSLAGSFGPALGDQVGATGVVKTVIDYKVSSGLWSNDIRNWYERATEQMASDNPEAVVFMIGTNDAPVVNKVDANNDGVPDWEASYRLKVARMMDLLVGPHHRTVFWLGPPTLGDQNMDRGAAAIGPVMRDEAAKRAPDVEYLDTYKLFSTKDGTFSRQILDENGSQITARISDGTHFTEDGAQYLARAVFTLIEARWKVFEQADPAHPIGWTSAPGSGESVPGYRYRPTSRYNPGQGSSGTTSPTSVPDNTTSPTQNSTVAPTTTTPTPTTTPHSTTPTTHPSPTTTAQAPAP